MWQLYLHVSVTHFKNDDIATCFKTQCMKQNERKVGIAIPWYVLYKALCY